MNSNSSHENIVLIPVYNDWKSLNKLLLEINNNFNHKNELKILIINDCSTDEIFLINTKFDKIKEIKVLNLNKNLGSQKAIAIGLDYLKTLNQDFFITIMDGDGEDDPNEINNLLLHAKNDTEVIVTSHRKKRNESFFIQLCYRIHLVSCFFLTWNWVSFGNFSCFHSKNLNKINLYYVWYAFSTGVLKSLKIKKLYAARKKRYFESSKVSFLNLIEHSLRINCVFHERIIINSFICFILIFIFSTKFNIFFYGLIIFLNLLVILIKIKNYPKNSIKWKLYLKNIKLI